MLIFISPQRRINSEVHSVLEWPNQNAGHFQYKRRPWKLAGQVPGQQQTLTELISSEPCIHVTITQCECASQPIPISISFHLFLVLRGIVAPRIQCTFIKCVYCRLRVIGSRCHSHLILDSDLAAYKRTPSMLTTFMNCELRVFSFSFHWSLVHVLFVEYHTHSKYEYEAFDTFTFELTRVGWTIRTQRERHDANESMKKGFILFLRTLVRMHMPWWRRRLNREHMQWKMDICCCTQKYSLNTSGIYSLVH